MLINLLYILLTILLLGVVIFIHELGHFLVGRLCGIGVVEFSMGFGPKLVGWRRKDTDYSIRAIPLGGYCKFVGEDDGDPSLNAMNRMPVWKRFVTVFAGPAMNFVLAYVAAVVMLAMFYYYSYPTIVEVADGTPAQESNLMPGDVVSSANGTTIPYDTTGTSVLRDIIQSSDQLDLVVQRGDETLELMLEPRIVTDEATGETQKQIGIVFQSIRLTVADAVIEAGHSLWDMSSMMLDFLRNLIFTGEGVDQVAGPVGIVAETSQALQVDRSMVLQFLVVISLNLGIMNLLPLPALDGGRLVFLIVEAIRRKPVPPEKEGMVHAIGLLLFFGLAIVIMWHDLVTYVF